MSRDGNLKAVSQNEKYYIRGGDLHLLAEGQLFRVHRYFFERESAKFRDELAQPASPGMTPRGTNDSTAIILNVSARDLEKLLWVFYNPTYSLWDSTLEDWSTILRLASNWGFHEVKALAIRQLESMDLPVVDRLVLYQAYSVDDKILLPRYVEICAREDRLSPEEADRLGLSTTLMVCNIREQLRSTCSDGSKSPLPPGLLFEDMYATIEAVITGVPVGKGKSRTSDTDQSKKSGQDGQDGGKKKDNKGKQNRQT